MSRNFHFVKMERLLNIFGDKSAGFHRELTRLNAVRGCVESASVLNLCLFENKPHVFSECDSCLCSSIYHGHRLLKIPLVRHYTRVLEPLRNTDDIGCPVGRFGCAQNGTTFDGQNTVFAASKTLDEIASGRLNPNI